MSWRSWTQQEETTLKEMFKDGATTKEVAKQVCRTPDAVRAKAGELGILIARRWPDWLALLSVPYSCCELARKLKVTPNAVKQAKLRLRAAGFEVLDSIRGGSRGCSRKAPLGVEIPSDDLPDRRLP